MISVVIPAFDEAPALARLLPALPERLDGRVVRPVVVNDGSTDGTSELARTHGVPVVDLWPNQGKSAALRAGLAAVRSQPATCVVLMDADGQHDPRALASLVRPVLAGDCDIVCGSRYLSDSRRLNTPFNRYLVRHLVVRSLHRRLGVRITDPFSGYRCLAASVVRMWEPRGDRYEAELELLFDAVRNGWVVHEVAVARIYTGECSKMGAMGGPLVGRLRVLRQYAATIARKTEELAAGPLTTDRGPPTS
ncbi:hypothetical protein BH23ACT10_BH23ACT10_32160 [soil metagenome]